MYKSITHDGDAQKARPLEPFIEGAKYTGSIPEDGQFAEVGEKLPMGPINNGDAPAFAMPPFANGKDLRPGH